jgi:hypothetical protein
LRKIYSKVTLAGLKPLIRTVKCRNRLMQNKYKRWVKLSTETKITEGMLHIEVMKANSAAEVVKIIKEIALAVRANKIRLEIKKK